MRQDLHNNIQPLSMIDPVNAGSGNTPIVSHIIDRAEAQAVEIIIQTGSLSDADATFTVLVEDGNSSTLTDNATVDPTLLLGTVTGASFIFSDDNKVAKIGYIGSKRYVRLTITPAANTGDVYLSAVAVLASLRGLPNTTQLA